MNGTPSNTPIAPIPVPEAPEPPPANRRFSSPVPDPRTPEPPSTAPIPVPIVAQVLPHSLGLSITDDVESKLSHMLLRKLGLDPSAINADFIEDLKDLDSPQDRVQLLRKFFTPQILELRDKGQLKTLGMTNHLVTSQSSEAEDEDEDEDDEPDECEFEVEYNVEVDFTLSGRLTLRRSEYLILREDEDDRTWVQEQLMDCLNSDLLRDQAYGELREMLQEPNFLERSQINTEIEPNYGSLCVQDWAQT